MVGDLKGRYWVLLKHYNKGAWPSLIGDEGFPDGRMSKVNCMSGLLRGLFQAEGTAYARAYAK